MNSHARRIPFVPEALAFIGLPLLLWALADAPRRTTLKESFSLLFILAFALMLGQFYLTRGGRSVFGGSKMGPVISMHKFVGYTFAAVLLVHPVLIVVPRYFESGIDPREAFTTMVTTFESRGILLGLAAWGLMLTLGLTSLVRKRLPMRYGTWKLIHGILSALLIALAAWHAIDLGRHTGGAMSIYIVVLAAGAILLLARSMIGGNKPNTGDK